MADLILILIVAIFFALTIAYVAACERLHRPPSRRN